MLNHKIFAVPAAFGIRVMRDFGLLVDVQALFQVLDPLQK